VARLGGAARDVKSPRGADKEAGRPRFVKDLPARAAPGKRHRFPPYPPHEQWWPPSNWNPWPGSSESALRLWAAVTAVTGVLFDNASFFGQRTLARPDGGKCEFRRAVRCRAFCEGRLEVYSSICPSMIATTVVAGDSAGKCNARHCAMKATLRLNPLHLVNR
jgi:hypothetical protein